MSETPVMLGKQKRAWSQGTNRGSNWRQMVGNELPKCKANFVLLTPITFKQREVGVFPDRLSVIYGHRRFTVARRKGSQLNAVELLSIRVDGSEKLGFILCNSWKSLILEKIRKNEGEVERYELQRCITAQFLSPLEKLQMDRAVSMLDLARCQRADTKWTWVWFQGRTVQFNNWRN